MYTKKILNGYFYVTMQYDKALAFMPSASAGVCFQDGCIYLVSYATPVIKIDENGWLTCTGTYSATTRKHISAFAKEYADGLNYYDIKASYEKHYAINILTGEIKSLDEYYAMFNR